MKAVIFDRDGVILDSEKINIDAAIKAFETLGIKIKEEEKTQIIGRHPDDFKDFFLKKYEFSYEEFRKLHRENWYKFLETTPLFKKTIDLIKKLYESKIILALTTSGGPNSTEKILKKTGLDKIFSVVITNADYVKKKPNPEPYLTTAKKLGLEPSECVVIEDTPVGVESAKAAGMKCIALPNEFTKKQDFSKADLIVDSADKITIKMLNSL